MQQFAPLPERKAMQQQFRCSFVFGVASLRLCGGCHAAQWRGATRLRGASVDRANSCRGNLCWRNGKPDRGGLGFLNRDRHPVV
jgi:hypothetical protein